MALAVAYIVESARLFGCQCRRSIDKRGEVAIADDFRMRIFEAEQPDGEANLLAHRTGQGVAHRCSRSAGIRGEFERSVRRSLDVDEDVPGADAVQDRLFREVRSVDNRDGMSNG